MNFKSLIFIFLCTYSFSQENILNLNKADESKFVLDGILSDNELENSVELEIIYEHEPGYNISPSYKTTGYLIYTDTFLYVGFRAYRDEVVASFHPRDNRSLFDDDFANIHFETYGDARNNIGLTSNLFGSQADGIRVESTGYSGHDSGWSLDANFDFKSLGRLTDFGYEVEFIIPFSVIPFPSGNNQRWKINLSTFYRDITKQGAKTRVYSSKQDRDNTCKLCQIDHTIVMNDIKIENKFEILPYISSSLSGERTKYYDRVNYATPNLEYGLGVNLDLNKNLSLEATINPDFSQVEADETKIDINSPTAINYPEKRPFFNKGIDAMDYSLDVFNSRAINNPSFAGKILNQGKKTRLYILSAFDEETPYLVPTQYESFSGVGGKSFSNIIRYQNFISSNAHIGVLSSNRSYEGGAYGNLFGVDALFKISDIWKFELEYFVNNNKEPISDWIKSDKTFGEYTVRLDGEKFNGSALYAEIRRETENWRSFIQYTDLSEGFRSDNGFITGNDLKKYSFWHSYYQFPNSELLKNYRISLKQDFEYNQNNDLSRSNFQAYIQVLTILNTNIIYNYEYNFVKTHLDAKFEDFTNHWIRMYTRPFSFLNFSLFYTWGPDISYRDLALGDRENVNFSVEVTINDNLRIKPSISYSAIKKLDADSFYFKGYIGRLDLRYQFTNDLNLRFISEYNEFSKKFFFQPLVSWTPNPDTIFYIGGNQNAIKDFPDYNSKHYIANRSQLFLKFQYLFGL